MDPSDVETLKSLGIPGLVVVAVTTWAIYETRVRPLVVRFLALHTATARKVGVTPADVAAAEAELRGKVMPGA